MSVDTHFYPLGSCTMKYNPKRNERLAALPGMVDLHPYQPDETLQGMLRAAATSCRSMLAEIAGLAGRLAAAGGRRAGRVDRAAGRRGLLPRSAASSARKVLAPDSAHGTNPASAAMAGFEAVTVKSTPAGFVDLDDLQRQARRPDGRVHDHQPQHAGHVRSADRARSPSCVHDVGGLIYLDGANMNAILGIARPGDFGADMMHYNPHKTFSGPHGGGGPGAGPIAVAQHARRRTCRRRWSCKRRRAVSPRLRSAASRSAACAASSATSACWCGPTATSARTGPTGLQRGVARTRCSTPTTCSAA